MSHPEPAQRTIRPAKAGFGKRSHQLRWIDQRPPLRRPARFGRRCDEQAVRPLYRPDQRPRLNPRREPGARPRCGHRRPNQVRRRARASPGRRAGGRQGGPVDAPDRGRRGSGRLRQARGAAQRKGRHRPHSVRPPPVPAQGAAMAASELVRRWLPQALLGGRAHARPDPRALRRRRAGRRRSGLAAEHAAGLHGPFAGA